MISRARVGEGAKAATPLRANDRPCMAKGHLLANRTQRFVLSEGDKVPTSRDLRPRLTRIQRALRYQADGLDLVLTGQSPLEKCWRARPQRNSTGSRHACWTSPTRCAGTGSSNAIRRAATKPGAVHSAASTGHMGEPKPGCSCNASLHPRTPASAGGPPSSTSSSRAGQQSGPIRVIHGGGQPRGTTVTDGAKMPVVTSGTSRQVSEKARDPLGQCRSSPGTSTDQAAYTPSQVEYQRQPPMDNEPPGEGLSPWPTPDWSRRCATATPSGSAQPCWSTL